MPSATPCCRNKPLSGGHTANTHQHLQEDLAVELRKDYTVVIVTHSMQQASRISDYTAFMYMGKLIEYGQTVQVFSHPREELTERYLTGRFG